MKRGPLALVVVCLVCTGFWLLPSSPNAQSNFPSFDNLKTRNVGLFLTRYKFTSGVDGKGKITTCRGNDIAKGTVSGSGFIVKEDGTIVTNFHVVEQTTEGYAQFDDKTKIDIARIKQWQQYYPADLAVLTVSANKTFDTVKLGDSGTAQPLDKVMSAGFPLGTNLNVTEGAISRVERDDDNRIVQLQHTAAITHGNSGGALYRGQEVIGVNVSTWEATQFHQAVPVNAVKLLLDSTKDKNLTLQQVFGIETIIDKARQIQAWDGTVPSATGEDAPGTLDIPFGLSPLGTYLFVVQPAQGKNLPFFIWTGDANKPYTLGCNNRLNSRDKDNDVLFVEPPDVENLPVRITLVNATNTPTNFGLTAYLIVW